MEYEDGAYEQRIGDRNFEYVRLDGDTVMLVIDGIRLIVVAKQHSDINGRRGFELYSPDGRLIITADATNQCHITIGKL